MNMTVVFKLQLSGIVGKKKKDNAPLKILTLHFILKFSVQREKGDDNLATTFHLH